MGGSGSGHTSHVGGSEGNGYGGGIFSLNGSLTLLNDTISGNLARTAYGGNNNGAGVYVLADQATGIAGGGATYTINNTIIGQASPTGDDLEVSVNGGASVSASGSDNIITTTSGSPTFSLTNTINVNPQLGSLGDNGGLSETMAITPGSPAAGAGDPSQDSGLPYDHAGPGTPGSSTARWTSATADTRPGRFRHRCRRHYDGSPFAVTDASVTFDGTTIASFGDSSLSYTYYVGDGTSGTDLGSSAPTDAGTYSVVAHFAGYGQYPAADSVAAPFTISPAPLTVTGITAAGKVYDGTTDTTIDTSAQRSRARSTTWTTSRSTTRPPSALRIPGCGHRRHRQRHGADPHRRPGRRLFADGDHDDGRHHPGQPERRRDHGGRQGVRRHDRCHARHRLRGALRHRLPR